MNIEEKVLDLVCKVSVILEESYHSFYEDNDNNFFEWILDKGTHVRINNERVQIIDCNTGYPEINEVKSLAIKGACTLANIPVEYGTFA
jgi:hypothetical protein